MWILFEDNPAGCKQVPDNEKSKCSRKHQPEESIAPQDLFMTSHPSHQCYDNSCNFKTLYNTHAQTLAILDTSVPFSTFPFNLQTRQAITQRFPWLNFTMIDLDIEKGEEIDLIQLSLTNRNRLVSKVKLLLCRWTTFWSPSELFSKKKARKASSLGANSRHGHVILHFLTQS